MNLCWQSFTQDNLEEALSKSFCLYVLHHPSDGDRPFYIGKAKYFGAKQLSGYQPAARYNSGYQHLLAGLVRSGFVIYIAEIGFEAYNKCAEQY